MTISRIIAAAALVAGFTLSATAAESPAGLWQTDGGDSRFEVTLCGDGTEVCAKLVHLAGAARTPDNLPYLNTYVLKGAKRVLDNKWRGAADYLGEVVKGTLEVIDNDTMTINGCKGALCQKFELSRI